MPYRDYERWKKDKDGHHILISWVDRKCKRCGRFLKKIGTSLGVCHKCAKKKRLEDNRKKSKEFLNSEYGKEYNRLHGKVVYYLSTNPDKYKIGDYIDV